MGHVHVEVTLTGNAAARTVRCLVDTGATYTMLPEALGQELGIVLLDRPVTFSLANNTEITARVGAIGIELAGRRAATTAAVLPSEIEPLLGVEALEALGLRVDPTSGTLEPTRSRSVLLVGAQPPDFPREKLTELAERVICRENPQGATHCKHPKLRHGEHGPHVPMTKDVVLVCCWCGYIDQTTFAARTEGA